ncbi:transcriptional regulator [Terriglobus roseus DSM 18391]|uniref:Transcriptional regulator n=1 Tax=Terriglobus roseus (strain DSM 18391 / NRRL B-41598 / KBS 63) TaxID=926566 RepID=I3ZMF5_TERRK|nr:TetR/AcrR family transcriptional regulator [Terriglobus roseus]AFL90423.1 transcriptional regulator [Terriglobus roseus DSM 18391]
MPQPVHESFEPRKTPVQARATVSVESILEATLQVLLDVGQARLTTTRVAERAGVSVGTLYQYFPNKSALLKTVMERHLAEIATVVEAACAALHGQPLAAMAEGVVREFLRAKLGNIRKSMALYAFSYDVDRARIVKCMSDRIRAAMATMLRTSVEPLGTDPAVAAAMLGDMMAGVSRRMVEAEVPKKQADAMQRELVIAATAYLQASSLKPTRRPCR